MKVQRAAIGEHVHLVLELGGAGGLVAGVAGSAVSPADEDLLGRRGRGRQRAGVHLRANGHRDVEPRLLTDHRRSSPGRPRCRTLPAPMLRPREVSEPGGGPQVPASMPSARSRTASVRARRASSCPTAMTIAIGQSMISSAAISARLPYQARRWGRARWPLARRSAARRARLVRPAAAVRRSVVLPGPWTDGSGVLWS